METVHVSDKYRIVITESARRAVPVRVGQEVVEIPIGDAILVVPLPKNPERILRKYLGNIHFNRAERKRAETLMVREASQPLAPKLAREH